VDMPILEPETVLAAPLDAEAGWWRAWRIHGDHGAREALVLHHLEFARIMAAKAYANRYNAAFEFADYMQFATIGLIEAVDRFDHELQIGFRTFSAQRIRGAILDGIMRMSEQQQQIKTRQRIAAERAASLQDGKGGGDVFEQLASVAVGLALGYMLEGSGMLQSHEPEAPDNGYQRIELQQLRQQLGRLVSGLPERERLVIKYHYMNHLPFETIANMLSLSKGRIAQLHRSGLEQLRAAAGQIGPCDLAW
jgi:RNA polymerase sigma factor FliA